MYAVLNMISIALGSLAKRVLSDDETHRHINANPRAVQLLFWTTITVAAKGLLPQPHPRPAAVLLDEDDAGGFEGGADGGNGVGRSSRLARPFGPLYRHAGHLSCIGHLGLREAK